MNDDITPLIRLYVFACVIVSVPVAFHLEKKFKERFPETMPYKWGLYVGIMNLASGPFAVVMLLMALGGSGESAGVGFLLFLYFGTLALCGYFIIKRKRWAWVLGTILQLNLIAWIINGIYQKNRWAEFTSEETGTRLSKKGLAWNHTSPPAPPRSNSGLAYYVSFGEERYGPFSSAELHENWNSGRIPGNAYYWAEGMPEWKPLASEIQRI